MDLTGQECVERCRDGRPEDFGWLADRRQKPLFSWLAARVGDSHQAEEAALESFVRAFTSLKKLRKPESFYSWLLGFVGRGDREQFRARAQDDRKREAAAALMPNAAGPDADCPSEDILPRPASHCCGFS